MLGTDTEPGIMVLTLNDLYKKIARTNNDQKYTVKMSYLEVSLFFLIECVCARAHTRVVAWNICDGIYVIECVGWNVWDGMCGMECVGWNVWDGMCGKECVGWGVLGGVRGKACPK